MLILLPLTTYGLYFACPNGDHCTVFDLPKIPDVHSLFSFNALAVFLAWFAFQAVLYIVVPGDSADGLPIERLEKKKLKYKINGLKAFFISLSLFAIVAYFQLLPLTYVHNNFVQLLTAAILFSFTLSFYLYASSFGANKLLAEGGNSGWSHQV